MVHWSSAWAYMDYVASYCIRSAFPRADPSPSLRPTIVNRIVFTPYRCAWSITIKSPVTYCWIDAVHPYCALSISGNVHRLLRVTFTEIVQIYFNCMWIIVEHRIITWNRFIYVIVSDGFVKLLTCYIIHHNQQTSMSRPC